MAARDVDDILTECLSATVSNWFEPSLSHPFLDIRITTIPEDVKSIPRLWVDDVQVDDLFGGDEGGLPGGPQPARSFEDGQRCLQEALKRLKLEGNPVAHPNMDRMDRHELASEKRRVKQELKRYDLDFRKQFGRLPTHTEKEPMRPIYVYYRRLKTQIAQAEQKRNGDSSRTRQDRGGRFISRNSLSTIPDQEEAPLSREEGKDDEEEDQATALELRIETLQSEKAQVRNKLQVFQERFVSENNRRIRFHKDILPIEREYRMYKTLKEDIAKAEQQLRDLRAEA